MRDWWWAAWRCPSGTAEVGTTDMGGAAAHLQVVVGVADYDDLVGGRVREGVVATRAGWARSSLLEALGQLWEADLPPASCGVEQGGTTASSAELGDMCKGKCGTASQLEHGARWRRAGPGRLEAATASVEGKVKLTGWDQQVDPVLIRLIRLDPA